MLSPSPQPKRTSDYVGFGLTIRSELILPELERGADGDAEADVEVRLGVLAGPEWDRIVGIENDAFRLRVAGIGRFEAVEGRRVTIDPDPAATEAELRAYLLGTMFGALFQQRGLLALHASAVAALPGEDGGDQAIAFVGESGAGKSTMAMALNARGHRLLCDDVTVVRQDEAGLPLVWPGVRRLKLWSTSIEAGGGSTQGLEPVLSREDKFHVPSDHVAAYRPFQLRALFLLATDEALKEVRIDRLRGAAAIQTLISHTFRGRIVPFMSASERHFRACVALLDHMPVYRLLRPWGLGHIDDVCDAIAQHIGKETK